MKAKILHKTPKGFLIGRGCRDVKIGSVVVFKNKDIGKVIDIFGPVNSPYIKILPFRKNDEIYGTVEIQYRPQKNRKNKIKKHLKAKKESKR
ncbi:conserved hypothetical protein [Methanocaldococcus vulcanius M7]|uniref:H/ACA RNA-protein complex component Gar1 n=1 Tax=Methanocaldococcus vulcanius (strain ATCC 700851 / DSM 12094 / M7) TaxID=579137 RepID=C9RE99_METVM|nr:Gar1/Naf1 family protein [Methanocaldococcus vulcanius]ACX71901.1 conserved hypothetical protein [Methanocaldococcus vulcanius M7]